MKLTDLGFYTDLENYIQENNLTDFIIGRVVAEHKERYVVRTTDNIYDAEILGNLRFTAKSRADFPAVGDWVAMMEFDEGKALIHQILPRKTRLERQSVNKFGEKQLIATNIDYALIVQAVDRDFSINRLQRYLTICHSGKVAPIIILNKIDLIEGERQQELLQKVKSQIHDVPVISSSNLTGDGLANIQKLIKKGCTYCLLGSSGVGKSTLINKLAGSETMSTGDINETIQRGKHVTTHRELIVLEEGGLLIDNPGMREVGITDATEGLEATFEKINEASVNCKYSDCTHTNEDGCAVIELVNQGEIDADSYENYLKMEREKDHFESTVAERRKKDKAFCKMFKN
ncbi:MAG: ribosome small subunit-dependent GTPase A, partial [Salinivirgaceae bacterium]